MVRQALRPGRLLARDPEARHPRGATWSPRGCSAWARSSGSAWWPPTTRTTCAARTPRRTTCCWPSAPAPTSTTRSGSASPGRNRTSSREAEMRALFPDHPEALDEHAARWPTSASSTSRSGTSCRASRAPRGTPATRRCSSTWPREGARARYGTPAARRRCRERLDYELGVINTRGLRRLLPDRRRTSSRGARARASRWARAAARRPARWWPTRSRITDV